MLGNANQLEQIFMNMLLNARDALAEERTAPVIRIEMNACEIPDGSESQPGPYVRICVEDNGEGMDEERRRRIFDPFFTTKETGLGTGLGLSTAYGIVTQHGGWIDCSSAVGAGTAFEVFLSATQRQTMVHEEEQEEMQGGSETVLVIDDEEVVRKALTRMLQHLGYTALTAVDGSDGLEVLKRHKNVDLVLLDLSMPRMSGEEVLAELRYSRPELKVVLFTGYAAHGGDFPGAAAVVQKPFQLEKLAAEMRLVLEG